MRNLALDFVFDGELLRAPDLSAAPIVTRRWEIWPAYKEKIDYTFPVIYAAMYRAPDGRLGLVAAKLTDQPQSAIFPWNAKDWGVAAD